MKNTKSGFTAPEVMFALIVVAIFITGGFQLYTSISNANRITSMQSQAANITYEHLRQIANAVAIDDCPKPSAPVVIKSVAPFDGEEQRLPGLTITSSMTAPYGCDDRVLRIEVKTEYKIGNSPQTERQALYVQK